LGNRTLETHNLGIKEAGFGAIATKRDERQIAILLFNAPEEIIEEPATTENKFIRGEKEHGSIKLKLAIRNMFLKSPAIVHYRIDQKHGNPYQTWLDAGAPMLPDAKLLKEMRTVQELALYDEPTIKKTGNSSLTLTIDLPPASVSLILITEKPEERPGKVENIRIEFYESLAGKAQNLVLWKGLHSRNIRTYEVFHSHSRNGTYQKINPVDLIDTAYLHEDLTTNSGYYKVRAVDYWGRIGIFSDPVHYDRENLMNRISDWRESMNSGEKKQKARTTGLGK